MNDTELKNLKEGLKSDLENFSNVDDENKSRVLQNIVKEVNLISNEEKRNFDEKMQEDRFELQKDHQYSSEKLEQDRFKLEQERCGLQKLSAEHSQKLEEIRLELEKDRLNFDRDQAKVQEEFRKSQVKQQYISLGVTTALGLFTVLVPVVAYAALFKRNLKYIYIDEGRSTQELQALLRNSNNLIKK